MCGKYGFKASNTDFATGSPPHVREIPYILPAFQKLIGITPACAGNTNSVSSSFIDPEGSPPHVREILNV